MGRENIFKPTTGNDSLHQDSNDQGHHSIVGPEVADGGTASDMVCRWEYTE